MKSYTERRIEQARKLIGPEHIELAKRWIPFRDKGTYGMTDAELDAASSAQGDMHYRLSSIAIPSFDDLWLAAQQLAEEELKRENEE